jgi:cell fate regulator YaaT (PSP1 superfamily)
MYSDNNAFQSRGCCHVPTANQKNENTNQHSCCKLDAYDYLADINFVGDKRYFDIVEVRFKNNRKEFFRASEGEIYRTGDIVAVEASPGHDIGIVSLSGEIVRLQMKKKKADPKDPSIKKIYRLARNTDIDKWTHAASLETNSMIQTRIVVNELGLEMKINDVEYQGDGTKAIFYYTAEGRVDFRELIKILAEKFSVRIEMKQIGVRQESSRLGGIGSCGRELCCSSWLTDFKSVSTTSARTQQLSMNPQKLAGQCGKLKCCLNFENDNYKEESKKFPPTQQRLKTKSGEAFFQKMDILSGMMWYSPTDNPSNYIPIFRDDVKKIQDMNAKGKTPDSLDDFTEVKDEGIKYDNVIGQDDLTRFDKKEKRPNNKNRNRKPRNNRSKNNNTARANNNNKANKNSNKKNYNSSNNKTRENKANSGKKQ